MNFPLALRRCRIKDQQGKIGTALHGKGGKFQVERTHLRVINALIALAVAGEPVELTASLSNLKPEELVSLRDTLGELVSHCQGDERPDCPILSDIATGAPLHPAPRTDAPPARRGALRACQKTPE